MIPDIDWKGLALPFAYLLVLGGALMTFSTIYRKRKAGTSPTKAQPQHSPFFQKELLLKNGKLTTTKKNSAKRKP